LNIEGEEEVLTAPAIFSESPLFDLADSRIGQLGLIPLEGAGKDKLHL
tara:strand:+ start:357 stop:500 length:144 start_codon:yes stop_codon:yes gene_type:complete